MGASQDLADHWQELRGRLVRTGLFFTVATVAGLWFSGDILAWVQQDLAVDLYALTVYEAVTTRIMIGVLVGMVATLPVLLVELLRFARPGLTAREYRVVRNVLPLSLLLFAAGSVFAYMAIVANALPFFAAVTRGAEVAAVWGLRTTVGFVLKVSVLTGLLFQVPVAAAVLGSLGLVTAAGMRRYRVHVVVAVLVVAAVATPPDIITQVLVTVPVIGLYEASILLVARLER